MESQNIKESYSDFVWSKVSEHSPLAFLVTDPFSAVVPDTPLKIQKSP